MGRRHLQARQSSSQAVRSVDAVKLVFLHGLPGVGKLTVARELAQLTGYKLFHTTTSAVDLVGSVFECPAAARSSSCGR